MPLRNPAHPRSPRRVSMEEIAKDLGVSIATVSRAVNAKPGISEETRALVNARLKEYGYHRSTPTAEPQPISSTIAFVVSDILLNRIASGNDYYGRHLMAVQKAVAEAGWYSILVGLKQDLNEDGRLRCVAEQRVRGLIGESWPQGQVEQIASGVPTVLFNCIASQPGVDAVATDFHVAGEEQLSYLYELGHRRIAFFRLSEPWGGWEDTCLWQQYTSFCKTRGLEIPPEFLEPIRFGMNEQNEAAKAFVEKMLALKERRPTAIMSYDSYVPPLLENLHERSLRIPRDISICGFNDLKESKDLPIKLTSYRQNFEALAREAVRLLLDRMEQGVLLPPRTVRVKGSMVIRESAAPPPKK